MDALTSEVAERVWARVDVVTGRLRAGQCAAIYQEVGVALGIGWAAVALRVPVEMRPSDLDVDAHRRMKAQKPAVAQCCGCGRVECLCCARLEREYGAFANADVEAMLSHATDLGGLSYVDLQHELWRRERTGQR